MPRENEYEPYEVATSKRSRRSKAVFGRFYVDGRLIKRALAGYRLLGLNAEGHAIDSSPEAAARRAALLATRWQRTLAKLEKGVDPSKRHGLKLTEFLPKFLAHQRAYRRPRTVTLQELTGERLKRLLGDIGLPQIDEERLAQFVIAMKREGLSGASVNIELRHLRKMLNWAHRQRPALIERVPFIEMTQVTHPQVKPADPAKIWTAWRMLAAERIAAKPGSHVAMVLRNWQRLLFGLMLGMRASEAAYRLQAEFQIYPRNDAWVTIADNAFFAVKQHLQQRYALTPSQARWAARELSETRDWIWWTQNPQPDTDGGPQPAWLDPHSVTILARRHWGFSPKQVRKTVASGALASGADAVAVSALLGHSQLKTTDRHYLNSREPLKRRASAHSPFGHLLDTDRKRLIRKD